ncbi:ACT domain repeat 3 [Rhynchospora pubera]|uniref:ACT domain-containing protein ACR n=1 Tax=Rhynchospora pubera TaxID=906938 RepID=A0AAV8CZM3_9POAL|nr:ACT domain repeat 3 [Rhynchospora pubera]
MRPYFDPEYENFNQRINPPRVCIDNLACDDCTLVKVDSMNMTGILLEVVQVLSDLDLTISKAYITSDGGWFMDVFHVTDPSGRKVTDQKTIDYIEKALGPESNILPKRDTSPLKSVGMHFIGDHTAIELLGTDRPGLLSDIFAVLKDSDCNVIAAEVWTHRMRVACVVYVNDVGSGKAVDDPNRLGKIEEKLNNLLRGQGNDSRGVRANFSMGSTPVDRRLHQLMLSDVETETDPTVGPGEVIDVKPVVTIERCEEKAYSVVNVKCKDRPKLLFDIVCTLTDMEFVVFHASVTSDGSYGLQELFIRRKDGGTLDSKDEVEKVIKCLEAAILRRVSEGFSLELCGEDRVGLLSDLTRVLREHGLTVARADVATVGGQAMNVFYVRDPSGKPVNPTTIDAVRKEVGQTIMLSVKNVPSNSATPSKVARQQAASTSLAKSNFFSFGGLFGKILSGSNML